ncbi:putative Inner membrane protein YebZ [Burkholderiales bacterium]|nr:putative Inner membrane protein YebZ [Burkholderiales bacterium]
MNLALPLDLCAAIHVGALMAWFGALSLRRILLVPLGKAELRGLRLAAATALASGLLWPWLQTGVVLDDARAALDPQQVAQVMTQTAFGRTWLARQAFVLLALLTATMPLLAIGRAVYFLVAAALASVALLGHAAAGAGTYGTLQRLALALHLLAAGAWLGALPVLWVLTGRLAAAELALALRRFSSYGIALVTIVVVTGALSAWFRTGGVTALVTSGYGKILLGKVGLVALMGAAALLNRNRYTPALERPDLRVQSAGRRGLRRSIAAESALGVLVVAVAVLLGAAEPPR